MENSSDDVRRFSRYVELARQHIVTPAELISAFVETIASHPTAVSDCFTLLPSDLAGQLKELVDSSTANWCREVHLASAKALQEHLRSFFKNLAPDIAPAPPLNWSPTPIIKKPCPYCGQSLRTDAAKQCRFCKMDWHDANNVYRRDSTSNK